MGLMLYMPPNHWCQSTEGKLLFVKKILAVFLMKKIAILLKLIKLLLFETAAERLGSL